jgi:hypothetical protein
VNLKGVFLSLLYLAVQSAVQNAVQSAAQNAVEDAAVKYHIILINILI